MRRLCPSGISGQRRILDLSAHLNQEHLASHPWSGGLLDSTLVIWGGEFGRMPISEARSGRDHNNQGFLMWMAGGGIKGGISCGKTDEIGYKVAEKPASIHDFHATVLDLLGIDHKRLTYLHNGRRYRLTDVAGISIKEVMA